MSASLYFGGTMQVWALSYTTSQIAKIDNAFYGDLDINNSGQIVYEAMFYDSINHLNINYIYLYSEGIIKEIAIGSTHEMTGCLGPRINDNSEIVYRNFDGNHNEIYLYSNGSSKKITDNDYDNGYPYINNSGLIVWAGRYSPNYKIYLYNGSNIQEIANVSPSIGENNYNCVPAINNNSQIVWSSFDGNDYEIYLYGGGIISKITNNSRRDYAFSSSINNNGDIVWSGDDGNDTEIYLYHNGVITQITNNTCSDSSPRINDKLEITWKSVDGNKITIYRYYNGTTDIVHSYELQAGEIADAIGAWPVINNIGQIAWTLIRNGNVTINLAKPAKHNLIPSLLLLLN
jgi:hypothetical protein